MHVAHGVVDHLLRDLDARVARAAQRHHLADGDADVRLVRHGVVAPAALVVLAVLDQVDRADQRVADARVVGRHAVDLAKEERREAMAIHRAVHALVGHQAALELKQKLLELRPQWQRQV